MKYLVSFACLVLANSIILGMCYFYLENKDLKTQNNELAQEILYLAAENSALKHQWKYIFVPAPVEENRILFFESTGSHLFKGEK